MGVLQAINSGADGLSTGFDAAEQRLLTNMALQVADRLLPELIQDMVEASINEQVGFLDFGTVDRFRVGRDNRS